MNTRLQSLLSRLEKEPGDRLAWQQVKKEIKREPEQTLCLLFFGHLSGLGSRSRIAKLLTDNCSEIFGEVLTFYRAFIDRTQNYGDVWGGGKEFWFIVQFLEIWSRRIDAKLSAKQRQNLAEVLNGLRELAEKRRVATECTDLSLPFLPQEVAWNLDLYLEPAAILADYPEFRHMHFLPGELAPLSEDLENYRLSPLSERYFDNLLHETRRCAFRAGLLYFAQTFPLLLQAKWAYAVYISLNQAQWSKHPFVRRLLANSYWEARAEGQLDSGNAPLN